MWKMSKVVQSVALMILLAACNGPPSLQIDGECLTDEQCAKGYYCDDNYQCVPADGSVLLDGDDDGLTPPDGDLDPDRDNTEVDVADGDDNEWADYEPDGYEPSEIQYFYTIPPSPQGTNQRIQVLATATPAGETLYRFTVVYPNGSEYTLSSFSETPSVEWMTGLSEGIYVLHLYVKNTRSDHPRGYDNHAELEFLVSDDQADGDDREWDEEEVDGDVVVATVTSLSLGPDPTYYPNTFYARATAVTSDGSAPLYFFNYRNLDTNTPWIPLANSYSTQNLVNIPTEEGPGTYEVRVRVLSPGSPDGYVYRIEPIEVQEYAFATLHSFTSVPSSTAQVGSNIRLYANASCSDNSVPLYRFSVQRNGGAISEISPFTQNRYLANYQTSRIGLYQFKVEVKCTNSNPADDYDGIGSLSVTVINVTWPYAYLSHFEAIPEQVAPGDTINLNAIAECSDGSAPFFQFGRTTGSDEDSFTPINNWDRLTYYTNEYSLNYTVYEEGTLQFAVRVRCEASENPRGYDDIRFATVISGDQEPTAWLETFTIDPDTTVCSGYPVTLVASGETSDGSRPLYRFLLQNSYYGLVTLRDWGYSNRFVSTASLPIGVYMVVAQIRHSSTPSTEHDDRQILAVNIVNCGDQDQDSATAYLYDLTVEPNPVRPGQTVLATAYAGGGTGPLQYRFGILTPEGQPLYLTANWSTNSTAAFSIASAGNNTVFAEVRSWGSTVTEDYIEADLTVTSGGDVDDDQAFYIYDVNLAPNPALVGEAVTMEVETSISPALLQYWIQPPGGSWYIILDWSSANLNAWGSLTAGTYGLRVRGKTFESTQPWDDEWVGTIYIVNDSDPRAVITDLWTEPDSPIPLGSDLTLYVEAYSPNGVEYQYSTYNESTGFWDVVIDWTSESEIYGYADQVGTIGVRVRVRDIYSPYDYDAEREIWIVITDGDDCNDNNPCTWDYMGPNGRCMHEALAGQICSDGNYCTINDTCNLNGICQGTARSCDDNNTCTSDSCSASLNQCVNRALTGRTCNDGNLCTQTDICDANGECYGTPITCDDNNSCTTDSCNPQNGQCVFAPQTGQSCNDNNRCTLNDACRADGTCGGTPKTCNDSNTCTEDSCNPSTGTCVFSVLEGDSCSLADLCMENGVCQSNGTCGGTPKSCDDNNPCTTDSCNPQNGSCIHTPQAGQSCNDNNACTTGDVCRADGTCGGTQRTCNDNNLCTTDSCNPQNGQCVFQVQLLTPCNDNNLCTVSDVCLPNGTCGGTPLTCDDANACTSNSCNPQNGQCVFTITPGASCSDGNLCTTSDVCLANGTCSGTPKVCNDGNVCTSDACEPSSGACRTTPLSGTACDLGSACSSNDVCRSGVCIAGTALTCNDGNPCTSDFCDDASGCDASALPNETPCGLGLWCMGGVCVEMPNECELACLELDSCGYLGQADFPDTVEGCTTACENEGWSDDRLACANHAAHYPDDCFGLANDCFGLFDGDNDGWLDENDNCPDHPNRLQENSDSDTLGDACDNCDFAANQTQRDNDNDGLGNACDPTPNEAYTCADIGCGSDSDCTRYGLACDVDESVCSQACNGDADCPDPWTCEGGRCGCFVEVLECPQRCSTGSQCPDALPVCADAYGFDGLKECTAPCDSDTDCPSPQFECRHGSCICASLAADRCVQSSCASNADCVDEAPLDRCLSTAEGRLCTMSCIIDNQCPDYSSCAGGACLCDPLPTPTCNYGSCILDDQCTTTYGNSTFCTGAWWPLNQRYCTMNCSGDLDCIAVFGSSFVCEAGRCECRD